MFTTTLSKKTYGRIFTCASSPMVHLKLTKDMSTSEFLQAFNCMVGRRGLCETMWSDNAKTFKSAVREIWKLYSDPAPNSRHLWSRINREELMAQLSTKGTVEIYRRMCPVARWVVGENAYNSVSKNRSNYQQQTSYYRERRR